MKGKSKGKKGASKEPTTAQKVGVPASSENVQRQQKASVVAERDERPSAAELQQKVS